MTFKTKVIHSAKVRTCTVLKLYTSAFVNCLHRELNLCFASTVTYTSVCMIPMMFMNSRATNSITYSFMSGDSNHLRVASGVVASDQHLHHYNNYHILYHYRVSHPIHRELTEDVCVTIQPTCVQYVIKLCMQLPYGILMLDWHHHNVHLTSFCTVKRALCK